MCPAACPGGFHFDKITLQEIQSQCDFNFKVLIILCRFIGLPVLEMGVILRVSFVTLVVLTKTIRKREGV